MIRASRNTHHAFPTICYAHFYHGTARVATATDYPLSLRKRLHCQQHQQRRRAKRRGSFRIIVDLADWDHSVGVNTPGQSGKPAYPHYRDLTDLWANGKYFPVLYSREKIEAVTEQRERLLP